MPERALAEAGRAAAGEEKGEIELFLDAVEVAFRVGGADDDVAADRGGVPELPAAAARGLREPARRSSRQQLLDAVRRVGLLARENSPVRLEFNALGVRLSSSSPDLGGAVEVVEAQYEGEDLTVAFNPEYLADGLRRRPGDRSRSRCATG